MSRAAARPAMRACGDSLLLVDVGEAMDAAVHARVLHVARGIGEAAVPGVRDVVPAYTCVGVHVDPLHLDLQALERVIDRVWAAPPEPRRADAATVDIPVCYGGEFGPDLDEVAGLAGCDAEDVIARHTAVTYTVFMLGFLPGFAYLGAVAPSLRLPRRASPREAVPAGSVGIAGAQTGVYPSVSPGGWRLIGRTPWTMFDATRPRASLLRAGDGVRFVAIPPADWDRAAAEAPR